jgi:hypothetical protein
MQPGGDGSDRAKAGKGSGTALYSVNDAHFHAEAFLTGPRIVLNLAGSADATAASHLQLIIARVQLESRRHSTQEVTVDFRDLEFMVSSCFKSLLTWINRVKEAEAAGRYRIRFLSDPRHQWQKRSLRSLQAFSQDLVSIEFDIEFAD